MEPMKSDIVLAAQSKKESLQLRLERAQADLSARNADLVAADSAFSAHVASVAAGDATADERQMQAINTATNQRDFQVRLVDELARQREQAEKDYIAAIGQAYVPMYRKGLAQRLKAAQDADAARAALFRAEGAFRSASSMIEAARHKGAPDPHHDVHNILGGKMLTGLVATHELVVDGTEQHERDIWQGAHAEAELEG